MINKPFEEIEKGDIEDLVSNQVREGRTLEYKLILPGRIDKEKIEFLADASSFANASGGDLIYGVRDKGGEKGQSTGLPESAEGVGDINVDEEIRRLEAIVRDGLDPKIPVVRMRPVPGFGKSPVIVIRIHRSWIAPHRVCFKNHSRFYSRNSSGKYQLDVRELRAAFALSESFAERLREFRAERLGRIVAGETPVLLRDVPKTVLHVVPINAFELETNINVRSIVKQFGKIRLIDGGGADVRYNLDGVLVYAGRYDTPEPRDGYVQAFRSGAIEAVSSCFVEDCQGRKFIHGEILAKDLVATLKSYLDLLAELEVAHPLAVMLSLLGVKEYFITSVRGWAKCAIDRSDLILPEIVVENRESPCEGILHPTLDAVFQAGGWFRCEYYDEDGKWLIG